MRLFAVWKEEEKIKIFGIREIKKILPWKWLKGELSLLPENADIIQAESEEEAIKIFLEHER